MSFWKIDIVYETHTKVIKVGYLGEIDLVSSKKPFESAHLK